MNSRRLSRWRRAATTRPSWAPSPLPAVPSTATATGLTASWPWRRPRRAASPAPTGDSDHFTGGRFAWRAGFRPDPDSVRQRGTPTVRVTAKWGYAVSVPAQVKEACIIQTARWYKRGQSAWADTVANPDVGQLMYRKELDPDVKFILSDGGFVKPRLGA